MDTRPVNSAGANGVASTGNAPATTGTEKTTKAKKAGEASGSAAAKGGTKQDWGLDISPKAKEMSEAYKKAGEIARATPDVREDRVADIKKRLAEGTYEVDSGKIADGMMREAMLEHLAARDEK